MQKPHRAVGVMVKNNQILLMRRIRWGKEYFIFPGGGVEEGETIEETVIRELKEELSIDAKIDRFLFTHYNRKPTQGKLKTRHDHFYLVTEFSGDVELGGPEKERMNKDDQFYPEWHDLSKISSMKNLLPMAERKKVCQALNLKDR